MVEGAGFVVSHSGRQHSYRVALALRRAGLLDAFFTSSYYDPAQWPDRMAQALPPLDRWLRKRSLEGLEGRFVRRRPSVEVPEMLARMLGAAPQRVARLVEERDMRFDRWVSGRLAGLESRAFWGFQGSCAESLAAAKATGKAAVIELASIPAQVIRELLARDDPSHADPVRGDQSPGYRRRLDEEPAIADRCVAASSFCARSLASIGIPADRIEVIPLGVDVRKFAHVDRKRSRELRVLFVGKLGRHKGLRYLLAAMKRLQSRAVTLTLAGPGVGDDGVLDLQGQGVRMLGAVTDIARVYAGHDVLVLPSLYEGFGLVVLEAMASGMPVIASENSCAPDVMTDGRDGFIVPAFDADGIAARLDHLAANPGEREEMGRNAARRAADFTWEHHAEHVAGFARNLLTLA